MSRMLSFASVACILGFYPTSVLSQTLSLQGNVVHEPLKSTFTSKGVSLESCAALCMRQNECQLFVHNKVNKICELATEITNAPSRSLTMDEVAYLRGEKCAEDTRLTVRTRKMGVYLQKPIHRYLASYGQVPPGKAPIPQTFCYAIDVVPGCDLIPFGSADGGKRLTKNTQTTGFVQYGFCTKKAISCNAVTTVREFALFGGGFQYMTTGTPSMAINSSFFCYFWDTKYGQCTVLNNSKPFSFRIN